MTPPAAAGGSELPVTYVADSAVLLDAEIRELALVRGRIAMLLCLKLHQLEQSGGRVALGYASLQEYVASLPAGPGSETSAARIQRVSRTVVPLVALPAAGVTSEDLVDAGIRKLDMVSAVLRGLPPEAAGEWVHRAKVLSVGDLDREIRASRGQDIDAAWREPVEWLARRLRAAAYRLEDAEDAEVVLGLLDTLAADAMQARARLEEGCRTGSGQGQWKGGVP